MLINEIFTSIDGEARRAGELSTFIRACGCCLRCNWCDSKYTWGKEPTNKEMSVDEIVTKCKEIGVFNITFTGGEPLIQKDADELINKLAKEGFDVCIETSGAVDFTDRDWFKNFQDNVWVCVDYKCPSSGQTDKMLPIEKFTNLRNIDVVKFVVARDDLPTALKVIYDIREVNKECLIYLSPVFGQIEPHEIVDFMKENMLQYGIRCQLQMHKYIWPPEMRGV